MSFVQNFPPPQEALSAVNPIKCLAGGVVGVFKGLAAAFRNKKRWIPALVLAGSGCC